MASSSPTPNLFLTNAPASEGEKSLIRQRIQEARNERRVTEIHLNLLSTSAKLTDEDEVRNCLQSLDDFIHDHEALLSSIRDLPPELLEKIFLQTTWVRNFETDLGVEILEPLPKFIFGPVSQVCRYWRTIALVTPGMWTSIPALCKWRSNDPEPEPVIHLIRTFLERSGNSPIHITVYITQIFDELNDSDELKTPCLDLLVSQCSRWKTAILHVDRRVIRRLQVGTLYTPVLESLNFRCRMSSLAVDNNPSQIYPLAPRLTHAIVDSWASLVYLRLPWDNIRTFTGLPNQLKHLRPAGPTLEVCCFRGPLSRMRYPTEPIHFAKLRFLSIINNNYLSREFGNSNVTTFRWIHAPTLTFLEIKGHPVWPGASLIVRDLLSNTLSSSSLLQSFTFHVRGLLEDEFKELLSAMPLLIFLDICDTPSHYFSAVGRRKPDYPQKALAPRLKLITIRDFSDRDPKPLIALCNSWQLKNEDGRRDYLCIDLVYSSSKLCLRAQDRIEGWDRGPWTKQRVPGSELSKIFGWSAFIANNFLARDEQERNYGFPRNRKRIVRPASQLNKVFTLIEEHEFSDPKMLEVSRLRPMMEDVVKLPPDVLPDEGYGFQLRAAALCHEWAGTSIFSRFVLSADLRKITLSSVLAEDL
ncbi:hypothetical protein M413DRAFT_10518 [Hebeloma cylindrosporum]|uniref:Uncharacterized protein n=1 Tax=Hebeloma cylindrosporum TaxID=76867 RepID=A0A0C2YMW1_HEBCY|nr:hypothetical protein M413DRAFT_10518 [Hebeloma cylindrosporum h7]